MSAVEIMNSINKFGRYLIIAVLLINLIGVVNADAGGAIISAMQGLCRLVQSFLGIAAVLLVVLAGVTYAIGQMMGAETRARAAVWATSMLTGAVIGIVIYLIAPYVIALLMGKTPPSISDPCSFS
ncbi:MAG: hypothetical protein QW171_00850 [Candidatus Bilamarchaeaceae archaeon]